jgi:uncharacterized protein (DUF2147 family)
MIGTRSAIAAITVVCLLTAAAPAGAADPTGVWLTKNRDARVRVADCGDSLCGTIVWLAQPIDPATGRPATDKSNTDPSRRNRPMVGVRIFGMQRIGNDTWAGPIYNADDGRTYNGSVVLLGPAQLKIEGCLALFCDFEIWARVH